MAGRVGFAASPRDLTVALMTCVASAILSFELRVGFDEASSQGWAFDRLDALREVVVVVAERALGRTAGASSASRSSLRATMVAGVHVEVDETAALIASRSAFAVVMMVVMLAYRPWNMLSVRSSCAVCPNKRQRKGSFVVARNKYFEAVIIQRQRANPQA